MKVSNLILENLRTDKKLRLSTAIALGVGERTILNNVEAESDNLTKMAAVLVYRENGFTDEQIFETETAKA